MIKPILSPLRYPGSKQTLVNYFETFVKENLLFGCHLYEAYAGGASVSLAMLSRGVVSHATLIEKDPLVYAFWKCVKKNPKSLYNRIRKVDVSIRTWKKFRKYLAKDALDRFSLAELGFAGLFFNRTNFSGIIGAGPIGGLSQESEYKINCRFNREKLVDSIQSIQSIAGKLTPVFGNATTYLRKNQNRILSNHSLVYIDPPYYQQGRKLYRYHFTEKQHQDLAQFVDKAQYPWIVSYDNDPFIENLFSNQTIVPIFLNYVVKQSRRATELLISNQKLAEPIYGKPCDASMQKVGG